MTKILFSLILFSVVLLSPGSSGLLAQEAAPAGQSPMNFVIAMVLMFAVLFFLVILPQNRKMKKQQQLLDSLEKGDEVLTQSGIYGKIYGIADRVLTLEIAPNTRIRIDRSAVSSKVSNTTEKAA